MSRTAAAVFITAFVALTISAHPALAATLPPGFTESSIATGLSSPTAMQVAPDGRLFVCEQSGALRIIKDGTLLLNSVCHTHGQRPR